MRPFEKVYTVTDYNDGPRAGVADFNGTPHLYESEWNDIERVNGDTYKLSPIDNHTFELARESWEIWLRWERAFHDGFETIDTHGARAADRPRHAQLQQLLQSRLVTAQRPIRATGAWRRDLERPWDGKGHSAPLEVQWNPVGLM